MSEPRVTAEQITELLVATIPLTQVLGFEVRELGDGRALLVMPGNAQNIRAGGTLSGPSIMALADAALYAAVLTKVGLEPMAVTSDLAVRFLRKPPPRDLCGEAAILHLGRRQAVGEVRLYAPDDPSRPVAHATGTYALPSAG
ncbi:acyl-CoA thioesterase [Gammaproteobacteria bacterium]|nr:PaaI family thioesterase [Sandaracinaceae bacterium]CAG0989681.1 acyl-CoA thioesterase [Gammaproteobacteria bacterium]